MPSVARDAHAPVEHLDYARRRADLDRLPDQRVRHAVVAMVEGDAVVDVDLGVLPLGELVAARGQRAHRRPVDRFEGRATAALELLERAHVELLDELADRKVELAEVEEGPVAQRRNDPPLHDEHAALDFRFVLRLAGPRRDHRHAVVLRHLQVGGVDVRLVAIGPGDRAAKLVGHNDLGNAPEKLEGTHGRPDEIGELLRARRLGVRVVAGAEHRDEDLHLRHLARRPIDDAELLARVVDEELLAGAVHLSHRHGELLSPARVQVTEAAVLVRLERRRRRCAVAVLDPERLQRHPDARQLAVHPGEVDRHALRRLALSDAVE
jgi:hypothetical protein